MVVVGVKLGPGDLKGCLLEPGFVVGAHKTLLRRTIQDPIYWGLQHASNAGTSVALTAARTRNGGWWISMAMVVCEGVVVVELVEVHASVGVHR